MRVAESIDEFKADMKNKEDWLSILIGAISVLGLVAFIAFIVWEVVAQIMYDGQFIEWRFIPPWEVMK